jgi:molecular chaperone GrpE (heat shock protein)
MARRVRPLTTDYTGTGKPTYADLEAEVARLTSALDEAKRSRAAADARSARRKHRFRAAEAKNLVLQDMVADLIDLRDAYTVR